jgi:hypothetical protein
MDHAIDGSVAQLEAIEPQRDVHRMLLRELGPHAMRTATPNRLLSTRAGPHATMR